MYQEKTQRRALLTAAWTVSFLAFEVALAPPIVPAEEAGLAPPIVAAKKAQITIPPELGFIVDTRQAEDGSSPIIVHLQEAHANPDAQRQLVEILRLLIERHGLRLILVEGGHGDVGLKRLRAHGTPEVRRRVLDKYLHAGIMSAEEYLDVTTEEPLILWGVEQPALYQEQLDAFLAAEPLTAGVAGVLSEVRQALDVLKPMVFDQALIDLEQRTSAFDAHELELDAYVEALSALASRQGVALEAFPSVATLIRLRDLEQGLDLAAVSSEQTEAIGRLAERMESAELDALIARAREMKAGTLAKAGFYADFSQTAVSHGIDLSRYPNLSRYLAYLEERAGLESSGVSGELARLAQQLRVSLTASPESRHLRAVIEELALVEACLQLRLTAEEALRLASMQTDDLSFRWARTLKSMAQRHGLSVGSFEGLEALQQALPAFLRFYEIARRRDETLAANAIEKLRISGERLAVLITGGFHSDRITDALHAQGFGVVEVAPRIDHPTDDRLYHAVLKYKHGQGSLSEVLAIANQATLDTR